MDKLHTTSTSPELQAKTMDCAPNPAGNPWLIAAVAASTLNTGANSYASAPTCCQSCCMAFCEDD